jgi:hypothetical protein
MKKKVLLILAFGVSFTPAIFAGDLSGLSDGGAHHTGQLTFQETMNSPGAVGCNLKEGKNVSSSGSGVSVQENHAQSQSSAAAAR